jgi:hypothetical protein
MWYMPHNFVFTYLFHVCYIPCPNLLWFYLPNNIWWRVKLWSPSLCTFSLAYHYFLPLRSAYLGILDLCYSFDVRDHVSHSYKTRGEIVVLYVFNLYALERRWEDKKILNSSVASIPWISVWVQFQFITVIPKYFNFATFLKALHFLILVLKGSHPELFDYWARIQTTRPLGQPRNGCCYKFTYVPHGVPPNVTLSLCWDLVGWWSVCCDEYHLFQFPFIIRTEMVPETVVSFDH